MKKFNILITGSSGFIGSHLTNFFKEKKIIFTVLRTNEIKNLNTKFLNFTHLIHLSFRISNNKKVMRKNLFDIRILKKYLSNETKFIFVSTIGLQIFKNTQDFHKNKYYCSKLECENFIKKSFYKYTILRLPNVYGSRQSNKFLIPALINRLNKNKKKIHIKFYDDIRDFIYIDDVLKIFFKLLFYKRNSIYNIFSNNIMSVLGVANIIKKKLNKDYVAIKLNKKSSKFSKFNIINLKKKCKNFSINFIKFKIGINKLLKSNNANFN